MNEKLAILVIFINSTEFSSDDLAKLYTLLCSITNLNLITR